MPSEMEILNNIFSESGNQEDMILKNIFAKPEPEVPIPDLMGWKPGPEPPPKPEPTFYPVPKETQWKYDPTEAALPYMEQVRAAAAEYNIPEGLLGAMFEIESKYNPNAVSEAGAIGIAQIMPEYHPDIDPTDPDASIKYGASYLRKMYNKFGTWDKAVAAYNTGPSNLRKIGFENLKGETARHLEKLDKYKVVPAEEVVRMSNDLDVPVEDFKAVDPKTFYQTNAASHYGVISPALTAHMGMIGMGPQPEGGFNEAGIPLDKNGNPYTESPQTVGKFSDSIAETFSGLKLLATHPVDVIKAGLGFSMAIPGFVTGMLSATGMATKELADQAIISQEIDLNTVYDVASKAMAESMAYFQPTIDMAIGEPTEAGQLALEVIMAPLNLLSYTGHQIAGYEGFADYPNIQGAAKFAGDITGLMMMGLLAHGGRGKDLLRDTEKVVKKSKEIMEKEAALRESPDSAVKRAQAEVLKAEKLQAELEAKRLAKKISEEVLIAEELGRQREANARAKIIPVREAVPKEVPKPKPEPTAKPKATNTFTSKKGNVYKKVDGVWTDSNGKPVTNHFVLKAIAKATGETVKATPKPGVPREPTKPEPKTDTDRVTGAKTPELEGKESPYYQDPEITEVYRKIYEERAKSVQKDPDLFVQKLINDVNRWEKGDPAINIEQVNTILSQLASNAEQMRSEFINSADFLAWKENVSDVAVWARGLVRSKNKQSVRVSPDVIRKPKGTQLNMMIPLDRIPDAVIDAIKSTYIKAKDIYRNKKLLEKTGFWYGRDGKWRFEIPDDKIAWNSNVPGRAYITNAKLVNLIQHPTLFKVFPNLADVKVKINEGSRVSSNYSHESRTIFLNKLNLDTLVHEIQHAINNHLDAFTGGSQSAIKSKVYIDRLKTLIPQIKGDKNKADIQGIITNFEQDAAAKPNKSSRSITEWIEGDFRRFARQSNNPLGLSRKALNDFFGTMDKNTIGEGYLTIPGEMEARLTATRLKMTAAERAKTPPWKTLDQMMLEESKQFNINLSKKYKDAGTKLYSGDPTIDAIIAGAKKVSEYTKKARGMKAFKPLQAAQLLRENFNRAFTDRSGNIRIKLLDKLGEEGYRVVHRMYLAKGSNSLASHRLRQMQKEVYGGLSRAEKRVLDNLILADRMVDIGKYKTAKQFNFPEDIKPANSAAYRELFQQIEGMSAKRAEVIRQRADAYFEWMKAPLKDMLDAGLISEAEFTALTAHNYRRIKLVDIYDKRSKSKVGARKRTVYDSGVESLSKGRETDIFEPSSEIMALEVFNRAYGRILNNEANLSLLHVARRHKSNPFVRIRGSKKDRIPSGWTRIFVHEDGKRLAMYISPEMAKEWIISSPETSYRFSQLLRYSSGSPVLRTMATGINWGFALANLPRDIMHTWFTARVWENGKWKPVYNPNLPVFGLQMGMDLSRVFIDAATKGKRYDAYIRDGGGMEFLVHQGRLFQRGRHLEGPLDKVYDVLGYFGETSEIMTRLAIRDRVIRRRARQQGLTLEQAAKDKDISREATFVARDYMDFGQGGGVTKALDNAFPYLNASVQGTRGLIRSFKPGSGSAMSSVYKLTQFAALVSGLTIASWARSPESMENMGGNIDAQNNLIIPLGDQFSFKDSEGQTRYPYFKIPLDPGQKFFKTFFEASTNKMMGREIDVNAVVDSLKEQSPVGVTELPPSISAALGYVTNKDFWLNEDIWTKTKEPMSYPDSKEEHIPGKTGQAYVDLGQATGLSPERTQYAVEELVTNGTVWSYLAGEGYDAFRGLDKRQKEQQLAMALARMPVVKRFFGVTNPYAKHSTSIDEKSDAFELERWIQNREMDRRIDGYLYEDSFTHKEVVNYARSFKDKDTYDRLMDRFDFETKIKDLPEKSFWRRLKQEPTAVKAQVFVDRLNSEDEQGVAQLWEEFRIVDQAGGVISPEFREEVMRIMAERR